MQNGSYLVTGGLGYIGSFVTDELASRGSRVIVLDNELAATAPAATARVRYVHADVREAETLAELFEGIDGVVHLDLSASGTRVAAVAADVSTPQAVDLLIEACQSLGGPPGIGVVNAGRGLPGTLLTSDPAGWEALFRINVLGAMFQMRGFAQAMLPAAKADPLGQPLDIVVTGSTVGTNVSPFNSVYGASKAAVHSAAEGLRREVGPLGIRVSVIEPGIVRTNFQAAAGYDPSWFESYAAEIGPYSAPMTSPVV